MDFQNENIQPTNTSGQGTYTYVPNEVSNKFNWGAFLLTWIWGIGNKTYITLLIFVSILASWVPFVGCLVPLGLSIWFGIKGNEWAWCNKHFDSIEAFHENQKKWAFAGIIVSIIFTILLILWVFVMAAAFAVLTKNK